MSIINANHSAITIKQFGSGTIDVGQREVSDTSARIGTSGERLDVRSRQAGGDHRQTVRLTGDASLVDAVQTGAANTLDADLSIVSGALVETVQGGQAGRIELLMSGTRNTISIEQGLEGGIANVVDVSQDGDDNSLNLVQTGGGNTAQLSQVSNANSADIRQENGNNTLQLSQIGGQSATIVQRGGRSLILHQASPGVTITQE